MLDAKQLGSMRKNVTASHSWFLYPYKVLQDTHQGATERPSVG